MIIETERQVTDAVLRAMAGGTDGRLREVMSSLVRHLHNFAREVRLTEDEFETGLGALARLGQMTNDTHNEVVLASDALGFSTLVCLLNNGDAGATETAAALLGPFWRMNSPRTANGGSIVRCATPGAPLTVTGRVADTEGRPLGGVEVDVWQASPAGLYENQDDGQADMNLRGKFVTDPQGAFWFRSVKPKGYPVPTHGPVGDLLRAQNRHPYRPAHLHFLAHKPGFRTVITQIFVDDDDHLNSDVVFGVTRALVGDFRRVETEDGAEAWALDHRFVMQPGESKLPVPPIK